MLPPSNQPPPPFQRGTAPRLTAPWSPLTYNSSEQTLRASPTLASPRLQTGSSLKYSSFNVYVNLTFTLTYKLTLLVPLLLTQPVVASPALFSVPTWRQWRSGARRGSCSATTRPGRWYTATAANESCRFLPLVSRLTRYPSRVTFTPTSTVSRDFLLSFIWTFWELVKYAQLYFTNKTSTVDSRYAASICPLFLALAWLKILKQGFETCAEIFAILYIYTVFKFYVIVIATADENIN